MGAGAELAARMAHPLPRRRTATGRSGCVVAAMAGLLGRGHRAPASRWPVLRVDAALLPLRRVPVPVPNAARVGLPRPMAALESPAMEMAPPPRPFLRRVTAAGAVKRAVVRPSRETDTGSGADGDVPVRRLPPHEPFQAEPHRPEKARAPPRPLVRLTLLQFSGPIAPSLGPRIATARSPDRSTNRALRPLEPPVHPSVER